MLARSTLPARSHGGSPSAPVISSIGFHVWLISCWAGSVGDRLGRRRGTASPRRASSRARPPCPSSSVDPRRRGSRRADRRDRISPVFSSSMRDRIWRAMRNVDGTTPLASPECTPSDEHAHVELAGQQPAQRRRDPQVVVVGAARVEADHEARRADALRERLDVGREVAAAALLAGLDQHDAAGCAGTRPPAPPRSQVSDGERRVAVVGAAAAVQAVALDHRLPRVRDPRASRTARAACRGGRRAAPCRRPGRRWRAGSP